MERTVNCDALTAEEIAELSYLAAQGRKALGLEKQRAEHRADDYLWQRGWFVPSRETEVPDAVT